MSQELLAQHSQGMMQTALVTVLVNLRVRVRVISTRFFAPFRPSPDLKKSGKHVGENCGRG
jgi:hypothetical protein